MNIYCPICKSSCTKVNDILSRCPHCLHIFQTDLKSTCSYGKSYLNTYLSHSTCDEMSATRAGIVLQTINLQISAKIIDIGYANGAFLKVMKRLGFEVFGMDLHGQDMGIKEVGFDYPVVYDLVSFFDALEHFEDISLPQQLQTRNAIVSLPLPPSFFPAYPEKWKHYKPGEHLHYFSPESLDEYMKRWGLTKRITSGHPEDAVRGRLFVDKNKYPNIYTAIYSR